MTSFFLNRIDLFTHCWHFGVAKLVVEFSQFSMGLWFLNCDTEFNTAHGSLFWTIWLAISPKFFRYFVHLITPYNRWPKIKQRLSKNKKHQENELTRWGFRWSLESNTHWESSPQCAVYAFFQQNWVMKSGIRNACHGRGRNFGPRRNPWVDNPEHLGWILTSFRQHWFGENIVKSQEP